MLLDHDEPTNYEEAVMSPDSAKWLEAMKSEMGSSITRLMLTVTLLSTKLDLLRKVLDKFKELTMMRPSHP